jgi:hypothetical protein
MCGKTLGTLELHAQDVLASMLLVTLHDTTQAKHSCSRMMRETASQLSAESRRTVSTGALFGCVYAALLVVAGGGGGAVAPADALAPTPMADSTAPPGCAANPLSPSAPSPAAARPPARSAGVTTSAATYRQPFTWTLGKG